MVKRIILLSCLIISLGGCVPVAFLAGATTGGAIIYDKRSFKVVMQDNSVTYKAEKAIGEDPQLKQNTHIVVTTFNHIVLLAGQSPTPALRAKAYALVSRLPNIKRIYNQITIEGPTSAMTRSSDTWITTKAKTLLVAKDGLKTTQMKVLTENGVVYLLGLTTRQQSDIAANVVRQISGVQKVVKLFEYTN